MEETYWFVFDRKGRLLLTEEGTLPASPLNPVPMVDSPTILHLPSLEGKSCQAVCAEELPPVPSYQLVPLRASFDILPMAHYQMAGKAYELLHWDACTKYCGVCGAPMAFHSDISRQCTHCGKVVWPQLATAIIVAVTRGTDEILLVQSKNLQGDYLGLVAGFVETGETLEECVRREVLEETNLEIKDLTYFRSQPWPYPRGLMVGFKARYASGELKLQRSELNKGGWYRRDNLPPIPGKVSLARQLIDDWLSQ